MELHQLRYFVAVADNGSFSRAADACMISQPSLSQQIIKLEAELGGPLFDRLGRSVALTDSGRELLPRARRILADVHAATAEVGTAGGRLSVGAIPTIAPYLLPAALRRLLADTPDAELTVREDVTTELVRAVIGAEIDAAVLSLPLEEDRLRYETVLVEPLVVALPRDHPLAEGEAASRVAPRRLDDEAAVVLQELHCLSDQVRSFCRHRRVNQRIVCRSTQLATVTQLVSLGLGLSVVPQMHAARDRTSRCTYRRLTDASWQREVVVAWHADRQRPRLIDPLIRYLRAEGEKLATWQPTA